MIHNHHFMVERTTGNEAPHSKPAIRARFAALLGAAAMLTGCADAEDQAVAANYVSGVETPVKVPDEICKKINAELDACEEEATEVSTEVDGTIDTEFLESAKEICADIAGHQMRGAKADARSAQLTEDIIASLDLGGSK